MDINGKQVARYVFLPQVAPRMRNLFAGGFCYIAFNMALVYRAAGLLPENHPYLYSSNIGRFGVCHVIAEAARNLEFRWKNIDQIGLFVILLLGMVMLFMQLILAGIAVLSHAAIAAPAMPTNFIGFFGNPYPEHDIAFVLLERVLGVPGGATAGFFDSCVSRNTGCFSIISDGTISDSYAITTDPDGALTGPQPDGPFPYPFHEALRSVMQLYSIGILVIGLLIFLYFVVTVIGETAQSGTPFGRRFNHVWAPLRMVAALGLLIPIANGLNSAQYITLYMAKWGSNFATNGWILFHDTAVASGATIAGRTEELVGYPQMPEIISFMEFFTAASACAYLHSLTHPDKDPIKAYWVRGEQENISDGDKSYKEATTDIRAALKYYGNQNITVVFGYRDEDEDGKPVFHDYKGQVEPTCGEMTLHINIFDEEADPGAFYIQEVWYVALITFWEAGAVPDYLGSGECNDGDILPSGDPDLSPGNYVNFCKIAKYDVNCTYSSAVSTTGTAGPKQKTKCSDMVKPDQRHMSFLNGEMRQRLSTLFAEGVVMQQTSPKWGENLTRLGWGGAAIWYNRIAQLNGNVVLATMNLPYAYKYPKIMENVKKERLANNQSISFRDRFRPYQAEENATNKKGSDDNNQAHAMYNAQAEWFGLYPDIEVNVVKDLITAIFGLEGLFNLQKNQDAGIHPMAQLVLIGKSLVESAIKNLGYSTLGYGVGAIAGAHPVGVAGNTVGSFMAMFAMIGLSVGFVLFYVVPFLPFIYFFFGVGGWVKGIFEAMVGLPLWALAHIRIDGNGLPGDAAMNGYYLIFEIFLRPILIIFGLIASFIIFAAQVRVLNDIWPLVVQNLTGFDEIKSDASPEQGMFEYLRGTVDTFFFTVIYAIVVYMLGMANFKLIDLIPNHILRWMGASVATFGEQAGDPAENLVRNTMLGSNMMSGQLKGAIGGLRQGATKIGGDISTIASGGAPKTG